MIDVYIIEEIERERRRDRRDEARIWITDPSEEPFSESPDAVVEDPPRVIVIDL